mgnify:CR=1 FL=1
MKRLLPAWVKWPQLDLPLLAGLFLLMGLGLVVLYSASGGDIGVVQRQAVRLGVGMVALLVLSQVPPHIFRIWTPWLYALGIVLLLATWAVGVGRGDGAAAARAVAAAVLRRVLEPDAEDAPPERSQAGEDALAARPVSRRTLLRRTLLQDE